MDSNEIIKLSENEKNIIFPSLLTLNTKLADFSKLFYDYFTKTGANKLFQDTNMEDQIKKFEAAFKIFLYNIQHPINLKEHLDLVVSNHLDYGIMPEHIDLFMESFKNAIDEFLGDSSNKDVLTLWHRLIDQLMAYFKVKLY